MRETGETSPGLAYVLIAHRAFTDVHRACRGSGRSAPQGEDARPLRQSAVFAARVGILTLMEEPQIAGVDGHGPVGAAPSCPAYANGANRRVRRIDRGAKRQAAPTIGKPVNGVNASRTCLCLLRNIFGIHVRNVTRHTDR